MTQTTNPTRTPFVMLFEGRSGSTYIMESLNAHPMILADKEPLSVLREWVDQGKDEPESQREWLTEFYDTPRPAALRAIGFKTKLKDILDPTWCADFFRRLDARVLLLSRRNRIKLAVSRWNGWRLKQRTGDWNLYDESKRLSRFSIDVEQFRAGLEAAESSLCDLFAFAESLDLPILRLSYEELLTGERAVIERICAFLGVPYHPSRGACFKVTNDDLREAVVNFDELKASYAGSEYEAMFDEVLVRSGERE